MYIIVGLGNPKKEYDNTRHNIGFDVIDALAEDNRIGMTEKKHKAIIGKGIVGGQKVILVKPQTYMNLSGESVRELIDYYKVDETEEAGGEACKLQEMSVSSAGISISQLFLCKVSF